MQYLNNIQYRYVHMIYIYIYILLDFRFGYCAAFSLFLLGFLWLTRCRHFQPLHGHFAEGQAASFSTGCDPAAAYHSLSQFERRLRSSLWPSDQNGTSRFFLNLEVLQGDKALTYFMIFQRLQSYNKFQLDSSCENWWVPFTDP